LAAERPGSPALDCRAALLRGVIWAGAWVADVFIGYKREERAAVERLAQELRVLGLSVWFDADRAKRNETLGGRLSAGARLTTRS
jgi:hypothetical protein